MRATRPQAEVLDRRALNRALLRRQLLLRRADVPVVDAVERLVGLQAQAPLPPYFGLWSRVEGFRPDALSELIEGREVVRLAVMRGTIHLVSAGDARALRPVVQPLLERDLRSNTAHGPGIAGLDLAALAAAGRALLATEPLTMKELGAALRERWPERRPASLAYAVRNLLPLVQVPPRGVWGASGQARLTTAEAWLGRPLEDDPSPQRLVLRYLAAFGPATVRDVQTWSGLTGLAETVEGLRPRLVAFRDERGRELFDLPDAPRPDPDTPAPVRFVAPFDNLVLSHADRSRVLSEEARTRVFSSRNGQIPGTVLVDGFVAGTWKLESKRSRATLHVELFSRPSASVRREVGGEGDRLLAFAAADGATRDVRMAVAG